MHLRTMSKVKASTSFSSMLHHSLCSLNKIVPLPPPPPLFLFLFLLHFPQLYWTQQMSTLHSLNKIFLLFFFFIFFSLSQFKLDRVSKRARYTVRQIPGEMFADKDSSYGPETEALCGQLWVKACLKLMRMLLMCLRRCPALTPNSKLP